MPPRAAASEGRGWTIVRSLGARAVPTSAALQDLPSGGTELVVHQSYRPDGDRAGGAQDRWELAVLATHRLGLDRIDYSLQLGHYRDSASYSPLLAGGAARENLRRQGAVAYTRTLSPVTEAYAQLQLLRQSSNLSLFAVQMGSVQAGLRWKF